MGVLARDKIEWEFMSKIADSDLKVFIGKNQPEIVFLQHSEDIFNIRLCDVPDLIDALKGVVTRGPLQRKYT